MIQITRIRRRTTGVLPASAGAPADIAHGELAFNELESTLYYGVGELGKNTDKAVGSVKVGGVGAFVSVIGTQTVAGDKTFTGITVMGAATITGGSINSVVIDGGNF